MNPSAKRKGALKCIVRIVALVMMTSVGAKCVTRHSVSDAMSMKASISLAPTGVPGIVQSILYRSLLKGMRMYSVRKRSFEEYQVGQKEISKMS